MNRLIIKIILPITLLINFVNAEDYNYKIVDTGQMKSYSNNNKIALPLKSANYFGQDSNYKGNQPSYTNNKDGTITDNVTGLTWQKTMSEKLTYKEAFIKAKELDLAGYTDWRVANIKEMYSLIQFTGKVKGQKAINAFIDTNYFNQPLGNSSKGEREIDAQTWTSTQYVGKTMKNDETIFGVNFVDGRIKGYPKYNPRTKNENKMYFRFVRGNESYGKNNFINNDNGTVSDLATGLMWQELDSMKGMNWEEALKYADNLNLGGYDDWRLPNIKELQSIVDYTRSPDTSNSPAVNPIFKTSSITNESNEKDYPYFWSSTTHLDGNVPEANAAYISFGKALGKMRGKIMDVHGAGAQRSDPKTGTAMSRGPQGDMIRVNNYVRVVRGDAALVSNESSENIYTYSNSIIKTSNTKETKNVRFKNKFITREDKNGDGKVSKSEFGGPSKHFNHLDKNNDGYITEDEAPRGRPKK